MSKSGSAKRCFSAPAHLLDAADARAASFGGLYPNFSRYMQALIEADIHYQKGGIPAGSSAFLHQRPLNFAATAPAAVAAPPSASLPIRWSEIPAELVRLEESADRQPPAPPPPASATGAKPQSKRRSSAVASRRTTHPS